jgi:cystathionine gamma-synthase
VYHLILFRSATIIQMAKDKNLSPETKSAQALHQIDAMTGGITPAIHPSSTFLRDEN